LLTFSTFICRIWKTKNWFFSLIVFGRTKVAIVFYILLCLPSDGSASQDWQSTVGWGDCWIRTQDCSFTIWCYYHWATTTPAKNCATEMCLGARERNCWGKSWIPEGRIRKRRGWSGILVIISSITGGRLVLAEKYSEIRGQRKKLWEQKQGMRQGS
jgi:hypothetical protein